MKGSLSYQYWWESAPRDADEGKDVFWTQINDSDGTQYTVRPEDAGQRVRCRVFAQNQNDLETEVSVSKRTDFAVPVNTLRPTVEGTAVTETTHRCNPGEWTTEGDFTYRWFIEDSATPVATGETYVPPRVRSSVDAQHRLRCEVESTNDLGTSNRVPAAAVYLVDGAPTSQRPPEVTGDVPDANPSGRELTCLPGVWTDDYPGLGIEGYVYEYQWSRNAVDDRRGDRTHVHDDARRPRDRPLLLRVVRRTRPGAASPRRRSTAGSRSPPSRAAAR